MIDNQIVAKKLLWLDDIRNPMEDDWLVFSPIEQPFEVTWVKSHTDFVKYILQNGLPDAICFDHDLGINDQIMYRAKGNTKKESRRLTRENTKTGFDCAKWLVDYCIDNKKPLPAYNIQSQNPVGKDNINGLLQNFLKHQKSKI